MTFEFCLHADASHQAMQAGLRRQEALPSFGSCGKINYMAKKLQQFKIIIEQDEDGYFVGSVPTLPGCHTQAKTFPELKKRIREAILLCLEVAKTDLRYRKSIRAFSYEPSFVGLEMIKV